MRYHRGFTLIEIILSMSIFLLIFTVMTQSFLFLSASIRDIKASQALGSHINAVTQILATDIDEYLIDASRSNSTTLDLIHPVTFEHVVYTFTNEDGNTILKRSSTQGSVTLTQPEYPIERGSFDTFPRARDPKKCLVHPFTRIHLKFVDSEVLETSFSSPHSSSLYQQQC